MTAKNMISFRSNNSIFYSATINTNIGNFCLVLDYSAKLINITSLELYKDIPLYKLRKVNVYPSINNAIFKIQRQLNLYLESKISGFSIPYSIELEYNESNILNFLPKFTKYAKSYTVDNIYIELKSEYSKDFIIKTLEKNPLPFIIPTHRITDIKRSPDKSELERYLLDLEIAHKQQELIAL